MYNIFQWCEYDDKGGICSVKYRGTWILVDNSYLNCSNTIPPMKKTLFYNKIWESEWLESMCKDMKCTFGIFKGRLCILESGIHLHGVDVVDYI